jgi:tRNA (guanine10-N2)-dimethyltransferase
MREVPFLFELSGEHPTLPLAEALACLKAETGSQGAKLEGPGFLVADMRMEDLSKVSSRLALSHRVGRFLGACSLDEVDKLVSSLEVPPGSISIRVKRFQGKGTPGLTKEIEKRVGNALGKGRKVDLQSAEVKVRALLSDRLLFYLEEVCIDREQFETRHVRSRPFFSPISLHPRFARALVNLTRVRRGQTLLDPFCGTGGILLEAATLGVRVIGSDISQEMIDGCKENMDHLGASWERLEVADIGEVMDAFGQVDAVATDPPYGRSATTKREPVDDLHGRAMISIAEVLKPGAFAGVVFPKPCRVTHDMELDSEFSQKVHRSLTRHYCLFKRR